MTVRDALTILFGVATTAAALMVCSTVFAFAFKFLRKMV